MKQRSKKISRFKYLTMGELADKIGVNRMTLYRWDKCSILKPKKRDKNGWRLYAVVQIAKAKSIKKKNLEKWGR